VSDRWSRLAWRNVAPRLVQVKNPQPTGVVSRLTLHQELRMFETTVTYLRRCHNPTCSTWRGAGLARVALPGAQPVVERPRADLAAAAGRGRGTDPASGVGPPEPGLGREEIEWLKAEIVGSLARLARALIDEWRALAATLFFDTPGTAEMEDIVNQLVHDLDLRERQYNEPEAPGIELMVEGLRRAHADDAELLDCGIALFSSLAKGVSGRSWGGSASSPRGKRPRQPRAGSSTAVPAHRARR
jgi:Chromate resistance exported protein